jgi:hypothetical protein
MRTYIARLLISILIIFPAAVFTQDTTAIINANRILMFVGNDGINANDFERLIDDSPNGFYYGEDAMIDLLFSSGLWMAGKVGGEIRTSLAYYFSGSAGSEFRPGPLGYETSDTSELRVYKISINDLISPGMDWLEWPVQFGAPVDSNGNPLLVGDQTLFSVYNDDGEERPLLRSSSDLPFYAEVRQNAYAYDREKYLGDVIFIEYEIENRSEQIWDSVFVGQYSDPDLGNAGNDLLGSRPDLSMMYTYSDDFDDDFEGIGYPVIGAILLTGEKVGQQYYQHYKTGITRDASFFPLSPEEAVYELRGFNYEGADFINPLTLQPSKFLYTGDPRYNLGWLDPEPDDKRMLISTGPFKVRPGEKIVFKIAFASVAADDKNTALGNLYELSEKVIDWHNYGATGYTLAHYSDLGRISNVRFVPDYQNWLEPVPFSADFAGTGIGRAKPIFGSKLADSSLQSAEISFHPEGGQKVYYYCLGDSGWAYIGHRQLPIKAFDSDDGRQLDLIFLSENGSQCDYCFLNSAKDTESVYRLLVTASSYTDSEKKKYVLENPLAELGALDLQYLLQFRLKPKALVYNIQDGQKISIYISPTQSDDQDSVIQFDSLTVSMDRSRAYFITSRYSSSSNIRLELSDPVNFGVSDAVVDIAGGTENPIYFSYHPENNGNHQSAVRFYNEDFEQYFAEMSLSGVAFGWPLEGDFNLNGWLEPADIASYLGYLYRDFELPGIEIDLDLNNDELISLMDVVILINALFFSVPF